MEYIFGIILILIILIVKNQLKPKYGDLSKLGKLSDEKLISNIQKLPRKVRISHEKITAEISKYLYQELTAIAKVNETSINKDNGSHWSVTTRLTEKVQSHIVPKSPQSFPVLPSIGPCGPS